MMNELLKVINQLILDVHIGELADFLELLSSNGGFDKKIFLLGNKKASVIAKELSEYATLSCGFNCYSMSEGSVFTCLSNDFGFDAVYEKFVDEYASSSDLIIALKSLGTEENIYRGLKKAKEKGSKTICFSGNVYEADLSDYADVHIVIPTDNERLIYLCEEILLESVFDDIIKNKKS